MRPMTAILILAAGLVSGGATCAPHDPRVDTMMVLDQAATRQQAGDAIRALSQRVSRIEQALAAVAESAQVTPRPPATPTPKGN